VRNRQNIDLLCDDEAVMAAICPLSLSLAMPKGRGTPRYKLWHSTPMGQEGFLTVRASCLVATLLTQSGG